MKRKISKRLIIQIMSALLFNANFRGFAEGRIYTGKLKTACLPGLNCYSCPGALGSCPIGSLQAVVSGRKHGFSFYVIGILIFFAVVLGRLICAFLCLFGLVQDLGFQRAVIIVHVVIILHKSTLLDHLPESFFRDKEVLHAILLALSGLPEAK